MGVCVKKGVAVVVIDGVAVLCADVQQEQHMNTQMHAHAST